MNSLSVRLNSDDALTLADALALAWRLIQAGRARAAAEANADETVGVRLRIRGAGDADMEQEYERLMNLLGYDA